MSLQLDGEIDALRPIRTAGDPVLRQRCAKVEEFGESTEWLASTLLEVLERSRSGAGLAANQIGITRRAFAYDLRYRGEDFVGVVFNPEIVDASGSSVYEEGCLSIPDFFWPVERTARVEIEGQNSMGLPVGFRLRGIAARLFLHETDHLDGLLIFDRIDDRAERRQARNYAARLSLQKEAPSGRGARKDPAAVL